MADDRPDDTDLPVSWDEAREVLIVVLLVAAVLYIISPFIGFFDTRLQGGTFGDDVAFLTRQVSPSSGTMLLLAGILIATTPPGDVVPALRRAVIVIAGVAVFIGFIAVVVELTRVSGSGMAARLASAFARSVPGALLAGAGRWLAMRVVPFDD